MTDDSTNTHVPPTASATGPAIEPTPHLGTFGQYDLLEDFAGGMAIVYRARHRVLERTVAVKVLYPGRFPQIERTRFETEAKAIAQLRHPHIIAVDEFGECEGKPYFTMDFIAGGSLRDHLREYCSDIRRAVALAVKIARAMQHAHERGIVHRDLKPANILMRGPDDPVVADFGLAKIRDSNAKVTKTGAVMGTPAYMAPEQLLGRNDLLSPATDVWALGVILHELLTGERPFKGGTHEEVASTVLNRKPQPPSQVEPSVPAELDLIVLRCLARESDDRYGSAGELADDLSRWLVGERPKKRPVTRAARRRRRRRVIAAFALVTLILTIAAAATLWWCSLDREARSRNELAVTGKLVLVGPTGPPIHYERLAGVMESTVSDDGVFTIKSAGLCLLELMATTGQDRFLFRAEIQHVGEDKGTAGIYVGRRAFRPADEEWHCFLLAHAAHAPSRANAAAANEARRERFDGRSFDIKYVERETERQINRAPVVIPSGPKPSGDWERIEFDVSPEFIGVKFAGIPQQSVARADLMQLGRNTALNRPNFRSLTPVYDPRDGVGVYVNRCTIRLRNVIVERGH